MKEMRSYESQQLLVGITALRGKPFVCVAIVVPFLRMLHRDKPICTSGDQCHTRCISINVANPRLKNPMLYSFSLAAPFGGIAPRSKSFMLRQRLRKMAS